MHHDTMLIHIRCWETMWSSSDKVNCLQEYSADEWQSESTLALSDESASCSWGTQFWWLLKRSFKAQLRNPTDVTSRLLLSCWIGAFAGDLLFWTAGQACACHFTIVPVTVRPHLPGENVSALKCYGRACMLQRLERAAW